MKKISQYLGILSITLFLVAGPIQASLSVFTEQRPRVYTLSKVEKPDGPIPSEGEIVFKGADLEKGFFVFKENSQKVKSLSFKDTRLESSSGIFEGPGELDIEGRKVSVVVSVYLEPVKDGFKVEIKKIKSKEKLPEFKSQLLFNLKKPDRP